MGVDLIGTGISMNNSGWSYLLKKLDEYGVDVDSFYRKPTIEADTCHAIADALEKNLAHLVESDFLETSPFDGIFGKEIPTIEKMQRTIDNSVEFWKDYITRFRNCNGCDIM